jgi:hypothetical protein
MMKKLINELRTWNWEAMAALVFCWAVVFYQFL